MNIFRFLRKVNEIVQNSRTILAIHQDSKEVLLSLDKRSIREALKQSIGDAPTLKGFAVYSQNDEDGILEDIFNRLNIPRPSFLEFGVAPEENNTNYLILKGSKGCWIDKGLTGLKNQLSNNTRLSIFDEYITLENIVSLVEQGCQFLSIPPKDLDLISLDLDGNDYYFIEKIVLSGVLPKVFCLEYNASFRPPMDIKIRYNENHRWVGDDYFGCSLDAYCNLLSPNYTLVSCNIAGANCFFVRNDLDANFTKYTTEELYQPARYHLSPTRKGHQPSFKYVLDYITDNPPQE